MSIQKVNLSKKFSLINDHWHPRVIGELNGQHIKIVKAKGNFEWHKHDNEDEMFMVIKGEFKMHLRDKILQINSGELIIIPKGIEHKPVADNEVELMLFEPTATINTGENHQSNLTKSKLDWI